MVNVAPAFHNTYRANGLVSDLLDNFLTDPFFSEDDFQNRNSSNIKVIEEAKRYIIRFPVPGYNRHTLHLEIEGNNLVVKGNKHKPEQESHTEGQISSQYIQLYSFTLPQDANDEYIKAVCRNGLLNVSIKKHRTSTKAKTIRISNGSIWAKRWSRGASLWRKLKQGLKFRRGSKSYFSLFKQASC